MTALFANNLSGVLSAPITDSALTLVLATGTGVNFPSPTGDDYFMLAMATIDGNLQEDAWEIVKVTGRSTDTLTIVRGQEGTIGLAWPSATRVEMRVTAAQAAGFMGRKNLLINGDFSVNQRAGTRTPGVGVYGFDRWQGHASGLEQIVEGLGISAGAITLSWSGGGTGSIDGGGATASPVSGTATAATNISVVVPDDATNVQLEFGDQATDFEYVHPSDQLARCERYYIEGLWGLCTAANQYSFGLSADTHVFHYNFPVTMRTAPTIVEITAPTYVNCVSAAIEATKYGAYCGVATVTSGKYSALGGVWSADAEL